MSNLNRGIKTMSNLNRAAGRTTNALLKLILHTLSNDNITTAYVSNNRRVSRDRLRRCRSILSFDETLVTGVNLTVNSIKLINGSEIFFVSVGESNEKSLSFDHLYWDHFVSPTGTL